MKERGPLIAGLVGAALILIVLVGLVLPKASAVRSKQREVETAQQQQADLTASLEQLKAAAKDAPKDRKKLAKLQAQVPPTADLPGLVRLLNNAASQSGVDFISIQPGQPGQVAGQDLSSIPVSISVNGSFFAIDEYLTRLETLPRVATVGTVNITSNPDQAAGSQLSVILSTQFFTTDTSAGPGSVPGPSETTGPGAVPSSSPSATPSSGG